MDIRINVDNKLIIRPITMDDTEMVVSWRNNPRVRDNFLYRGPFTAEIHENWMNTKVRDGKVIQFIVEEILDQTDLTTRPIGSVYYRDVDMENKTAEYGIFIGEDDAAGHGYGNIIASWAVNYAKDVLKLKSLTLRALADNTSAVKSYENAGYKKYKLEENFIDGRDLVFMRVDFD